MKRRFPILMAVLGAGSLGVSLTSCNPLACGPGTVQKQQADGTLKCEAADRMESQTPCDVDAGNVVIVGGKCVSAVQCDPATTVDVNGVCVGTGTSPVPKCSTPAPGKACVAGAIKNFTNNADNTVTPLHVALYDPNVLLGGGAPIDQTDLTSGGGGYVFQNFAPPGLGLIVVVTGEGNANMTMAGTGQQGIAAGNSYVLDAYAIKKTDSDGWGFDIATAGAQIGKFYLDTKPAPNLLVANETMPAMGVTYSMSGSSAGVQYFNAGITAIDAALTATGTSGVGIVAAPVSGNFPTFTGMGGGVSMWETLPGGSKANLVLITRFHPF
jgi:hypothetical protein